MSKRDFLSLHDLTKDELLRLFTIADRLRTREYNDTPLAGKNIALIFAKSSTRTRVSFEVGINQLGGHGLFLSSRDIQIGRGEPLHDTARVLSRFVDGIVIRTFAHHDVEVLAEHASVPVINALTDLLHPCQLLADLYTIRNNLGDLEKLTVAWIGDGNNMAHSWINAAAIFGFRLRLACPAGYEPDAEILAKAREMADIVVTHDPTEAARDAHVINTDVWASMGQEDEAAARIKAFQGYIVDRNLMGLASKDAIFLHCLPAHRGEEVSDDVIEGSQSRVFDQAENRLHAQKALLLILFDVKGIS